MRGCIGSPAGVLAAAVLVSTAAAAQGPPTLTLREAIGEALARSPRLRSVDDARAVATIRADQAGAQYGIKVRPTLSAGSDPFGASQQTLGLDIAKRVATGADVSLNATSFRYGDAPGMRDTGYTLNVSQPLFRGFGVVTAAERALAKRPIASADRAALEARRQLIVSAADAYFNVLRHRHAAANAQRALERASNLRVSSAARSKVGLATELDVLRADLLAARAESAFALAHEQHESAVDMLVSLIGRGLERSVDVADQELSDEALQAAGLGPDGDVVAGPAEEVEERLARSALARRADVLEARDRIADARRSETIAKWALFPQTAVNVSYTKRGLGTSTDLFGPLLNGWRVGITTGYGFDRSGERAASAMASIAVRGATNDADDVERTVRAEVRKAHRAWIRSRSVVEIQMKAVALAERQVQLATMRYERGVAGNFDVVDAEHALFQGRGELESARIDRAMAGLTLLHAAGLLDPGRFQP